LPAKNKLIAANALTLVGANVRQRTATIGSDAAVSEGQSEARQEQEKAVASEGSPSPIGEPFISTFEGPAVVPSALVFMGPDQAALIRL
jgi:hypothetical protein